MKTWDDVAAAVRSGLTFVIEFKKDIREQEGYLEPGMRGLIVGCRDEDDTCMSFVVDLTAHEAFNANFEQANYFDKNGIATLTARQAGYYPKDNRENFWVDQNENTDRLVVFLDSNASKLFQEFVASNPATSYVSWLESRVRELRAPAEA